MLSISQPELAVELHACLSDHRPLRQAGGYSGASTRSSKGGAQVGPKSKAGEPRSPNVMNQPTQIMLALPAIFPASQIVITANADTNPTQQDSLKALARHVSGDWGEVRGHDRLVNEVALKKRGTPAFGLPQRGRPGILDHDRVESERHDDPDAERLLAGFASLPLGFPAGDPVPALVIIRSPPATTTWAFLLFRLLASSERANPGVHYAPSC